MINRTIFREHKLPVARNKGRVPFFLDFSGKLLSAQFIEEFVTNTLRIIDGVIISPQSLGDLRTLNVQEIWVRVGRDAVSILSPDYLSQSGVSGITSDLFLGGSASDEADNIQNLSFLRSLSLKIGLPLIIDLHVFNQWEDQDSFLEIVELGLNLAIELGGNIAILPEGDYLSANNHIEQIAALPILIKQPISQLNLHNPPEEAWPGYLEKLSGVIFTDLQHWDQSNDNLHSLDVWANSLRYQPVGG